ncbi:putative signal transducing protein [Saccharicrinis aurantiacus]|uniref:putative signal transducing protein n=1 Tax=Saccharicrinis aurantiacus TaxID=1849719 RepID=UPI00094FE1D1|nr:DUF2007 domain-containing protein [Saccharicrinis aurantiacus]
MKAEIIELLTIGDKFIAEEIQRILEDKGIYALLESDNPASSFLNTSVGTGTIENISIKINSLDYEKASTVIKDTSYSDLLTKS